MVRKPSLAPELYATASSKTDERLMRMMEEQDEGPVPTDSSLPRISLVVGPSPFTMMRGWEFFLTAPYEGMTYIATVLHNAGYPVRIIDVRYAADPIQEAFDQITEGTDVLGVSTFEDNYPFVKELIDKVKEAEPGIPVICGGSLATSVPHVFMEHTQTDICVISEGELTILELMDNLRLGRWGEGLKDVNGIWYRTTDGEVVRTAPRGQMVNLDSLPKMRLDLWPQAKSPMGLQPQVIASYSRGCKMDCSFCYRTTPQVSMKSPAKLDADLTWLKDRYNTEFVLFADLTFNAVKPVTLDILDVIKGHNIRWTCLTRCADVDKEQLDAMRESGCDIALYGVESLGAAALKEARKPTTQNVSLRAMHLTFDAGVRFGALLIVGLPGETEETLNNMADWAEEHNHVTRVKYLSLIPGTTFYQEGLNNGVLKSEVDHLSWLSIEQALHEDEFLNVSGLPEEKVRRAYVRTYDAYQPGPVMQFEHFPELFDYFHPSSDSGGARSTRYAGEGWRAKFSSAGPRLCPGSERFTLDKVGTAKSAREGASLTTCGAKVLEKRA